VKKSLILLLIIGLFAVLSAQTVTVTAPNGGETLIRGSQKTITWTKVGFTENVKIDLYKNGVLQQNISTSAAGTSFNWTVPNNIYGSDFKIKVTSTSAAFINDYSDNFFTIYGGVINVTAPNGAEVLQRDQPFNITWTDDLSENVKIELYQNGVLSSVVAASVPSNGSYAWTVTNNVSGTDFKIKISSVNIAEINDLSNADFTISSGTITITAPNGGVINRGGNLEITWTDNISENVKIELLQGGTVYLVIAASVASNGSYTYQVPLNISGLFRVRISSVNLSTITDDSDNDFQIAAGSISVSSPTSGEVFGLCMEQEIKWNNTIANDPVKIELYKGGVVYSQITANAGATGSYLWTLPVSLPVATNYQVKISSIALNSVIATANFAVNGTLINGGNVSGIWQAAGSPFVVTAKATVATGSSLEIKPGANVVIFDTLKVNGSLLSTGLQNNSKIVNYAPLVASNGSVQLDNCIFGNKQTVWDKTFNGTANNYDEAKNIVQTTDGGYAIAGYTQNNSNYDALVIKLDDSGNQMWIKTFNGIANQNDMAKSILQTMDGCYVVAGYTTNNNSSEYDAWVIKLDKNGNTIWNKSFNGTANGTDIANDIIQTRDGGYVVAGCTYNQLNGFLSDDFWIIKLDASGNKIWDKTFGNERNQSDEAYSIVQTADGGYTVTGYTYINNRDVWVIKLDSVGNQIWSKTFNGSANGDDYSYDIIQTTEGGYVVAGMTNDFYDTSTCGAWIIKLGNDGNKVWDKTFNGVANRDFATGIAQTTDGGYAICGITNKSNINGWTDVLLIKLNASGNKTWDKTFSGTTNDHDGAYSILQTTDGGYALSGFTDNDAWIIKLDLHGNKLPSNKIIMQNANANSHLKNCLISNSNKSAIRLVNSSPAITNCTFSQNSADKGGAIYSTGSSTPKITNSIFWGNTATTGKQIYLDGTTAKPEFKYNLIEGGYTAIGLGNGAALGEIWEGNITNNPLFTDTIKFQIPVNSPAINAGSPDITGLNLPAYDLWGNARVAFNRIDIGAYEVPDPSDINNNLINDWNLSQNYPNPFNPQTTINYTIKDGYNGLVKLKIYNAKGEIVQTITNNIAKAGHYSQVFNGSKFASGIYYYRIEAGDFKQMKKMVMVK